MSATKRCCTCKLDVPLTEFNRRASAPDGLQARCRSCCRAWYEANRTAHLARMYEHTKAQRVRHAARMAAYLADRECVDCGERDIRCLEFDHRDRSTKTKAVALLVRDGVSWAVILAEIEKCDVRCANCHSRKTAAENNSWRHRVFLLSLEC